MKRTEDTSRTAAEGPVSRARRVPVGQANVVTIVIVMIISLGAMFIIVERHLSSFDEVALALTESVTGQAAKQAEEMRLLMRLVHNQSKQVAEDTIEQADQHHAHLQVLSIDLKNYSSNVKTTLENHAEKQAAELRELISDIHNQAQSNQAILRQILKNQTAVGLANLRVQMRVEAKLKEILSDLNDRGDRGSISQEALDNLFSQMKVQSWDTRQQQEKMMKVLRAIVAHLLAQDKSEHSPQKLKILVQKVLGEVRPGGAPLAVALRGSHDNDTALQDVLRVAKLQSDQLAHIDDRLSGLELAVSEGVGPGLLKGPGSSIKGAGNGTKLNVTTRYLDLVGEVREQTAVLTEMKLKLAALQTGGLGNVETGVRSNIEDSLKVLLREMKAHGRAVDDISYRLKRLEGGSSVSGKSENSSGEAVSLDEAVKVAEEGSAQSQSDKGVLEEDAEKENATDKGKEGILEESKADMEQQNKEEQNKDDENKEEQNKDNENKEEQNKDEKKKEEQNKDEQNKDEQNKDEQNKDEQNKDEQNKDEQNKDEQNKDKQNKDEENKEDEQKAALGENEKRTEEENGTDDMATVGERVNLADPAQWTQRTFSGNPAFVRYSGYRAGASQLISIGIRPGKPATQLETSACWWQMNGGNRLTGEVVTISPQEIPDVPYMILIIFCNFKEDVPLDGGYLVGTIDKKNFVLYREEKDMFPSLVPSSPFKTNVTMCILPGLREARPRLVREFVEYHQLAGIDHFVLYRTAGISDAINLTLQAYIGENLVEVTPYTTLSDYGSHSEVLAIHDCLYRAHYTSSRVMFGDFNEFIWVEPSQSLSTLLQKYEDKQWLSFGSFSWDPRRCIATGMRRRRKLLDSDDGSTGSVKRGDAFSIERMTFVWPEPLCHDKEEFSNPELCLGFSGHRRIIANPRVIMGMKNVYEVRPGDVSLGLDVPTSELRHHLYHQLMEQPDSWCEEIIDPKDFVEGWSYSTVGSDFAQALRKNHICDFSGGRCEAATSKKKKRNRDASLILG